MLVVSPVLDIWVVGYNNIATEDGNNDEDDNTIQIQYILNWTLSDYMQTLTEMRSYHTQALLKEGDVRMDVFVTWRPYSLVDVHHHLEERRNDEKWRNDLAGLEVDFVPLLYFPDHDLTSVESSEAAFSQDWYNSSQHLSRKYFEWKNSRLPYQCVFAGDCSYGLNQRKEETSSQNFGINLISNEADVKYESVLQDRGDIRNWHTEN